LHLVEKLYILKMLKTQISKVLTFLPFHLFLLPLTLLLDQQLVFPVDFAGESV
jgi:hypothetical protein